MTSELDRVRAIKPALPPPSASAHAAAMARLQAAIADEPVGRHDRTGREQRRRGARQTGSWRRRVLLAAAVVVPVLVVALGALALLSHRGGSQGAAASSHTRGRILASGGQVLVGSHAGYDVQITPAALLRGAAARTAELGRLATTLGVRRSRCPSSSAGGRTEDPVTCAIQATSLRSSTPVTVATGVSATVRRAIAHGAGQLPGVSVIHAQVATYPYGALAASALGAVAPRSAGSKGSSTTAGMSGLEASYNSQLTAGGSVRTSLDLALERAGDRALAKSIAVNHATSGAFVAIDPQTGAIDAIDSLPAVDPAQPGDDQPSVDLAVQGSGPVGSAFGPITALAALESGRWQPDETYDDTGTLCVGTGGSRECRSNSGGTAYGVLNLTSALRVQDNNFLGNLGALTNLDPLAHPQGGPAQQWGRKLGIGQKTGIDLPDETAGTLPTPAWVNQHNRLESECDHATGPFAGKRTHPPGGCGIADGTNRPWSVGDNINLAVGQGDIQITPIQLAVAYAALANGGTVVRPHLATALTASDGTTVHHNDPAPVARLHLDKQDLQAIQAGMHQAASATGGTSADVLGALPASVSGQVGTAEIVADGRMHDSAWYAGYVTATSTHGPLVAVVWVQGGGFGDVAAAPVIRQLFSQWLTGHPGPYKPGASVAR